MILQFAFYSCEDIIRVDIYSILSTVFLILIKEVRNEGMIEVREIQLAC